MAITSVTAPKRAFMPIPASKRRTGAMTPLQRAANAVSSAASAAPANATAGRQYGSGAMPRDCNQISPVTPSPAPAVSPRMPGSASPLRVIPCNTAPANASDAPASAASTRRGSRIDQTIRDAPGSPDPSSAWKSDAGSIQYDPVASDATAKARHPTPTRPARIGYVIEPGRCGVRSRSTPAHRSGPSKD